MPDGLSNESSLVVVPRAFLGLGNPTSEYRWTPHNLGHQVVDRLAEEWSLPWKKVKDQLWVASADDGPLLLKTQTFMNVSGPAAVLALKRWKVSPESCLVICDDISLPWGRLRLRWQGRSGGHKGLESVLSSFRTLKVPRLRIGVGPVPEKQDAADFVLAPQSKTRMESLVALATQAVDTTLREGLEAAMAKFNPAPPNSL